MFYLDKLVLKWVIKNCANLGAVFALGPLEGAIMYFLLIAWGFCIAINPKKEGKMK